MSTKFMKWLSIMALLVGVLFGSSSGYRVILNLVVCVAAVMVLAQAFRIGKYFWGVGFTAIAVLFNPAEPIAFPWMVFLLLDLVCLGAFLASLSKLRWPRILPAPSITGHPVGTESL